MAFSFRPAARANVSLIVGLAGPSGSGKTYTGMRLATGICGPDRRFAVIDTEAGRANHYAESFRFDYGDLTPPFTPARYIEAITAADKAGYPVILVDSTSHEWAGDGGLLDWHETELDRMAGNDWKRREAVTMAAWVQPKMAHKKFVNALLQLRAHVVLCFRAEPKIEMVKVDGKTVIQEKKGLVGLHGWFPVTEKNLPYELTVSLLLLPDRPGVPLPIKLQEQHRHLFPPDTPITEASGAQLATWATGGAATVSPSEPEADWLTAIGDATTLDELKSLNRKLKTDAKQFNAAALARLRVAYLARVAAVTHRGDDGQTEDSDRYGN
jgi:AAA domain